MFDPILVVGATVMFFCNVVYTQLIKFAGERLVRIDVRLCHIIPAPIKCYAAHLTKVVTVNIHQLIEMKTRLKFLQVFMVELRLTVVYLYKKITLERRPGRVGKIGLRHRYKARCIVIAPQFRKCFSLMKPFPVHDTLWRHQSGAGSYWMQCVDNTEKVWIQHGELECTVTPDKFTRSTSALTMATSSEMCIDIRQHFLCGIVKPPSTDFRIFKPTSQCR